PTITALACQHISSLRTQIPLPPTSTLFPYTTLFRSQGRQKLQDLCLVHRRAYHGEHFIHDIKDCAQACFLGLLHDHLDHLSLTLDRKSTRLNSSHVSISYAVFCLK